MLEDSVTFVTNVLGLMLTYKPPIIVQEHELSNIVDKIHEIISEDDAKDNEYFVNLTCGTKLMFLATFQEFSKCKAEIFYHGIATAQFDRIFSRSGREPTPLVINETLSLPEFFTAFGMQMKYSSPKFSQELAKSMFDLFWEFENEIVALRNLRNFSYVRNKLGKKKSVNLCTALEKYNSITKNTNINNSSTIIELLKKLKFSSEILIRDEVDFITGGWLEEYIYFGFQNLPGSIQCKSALSAKIERSSNEPNRIENEFDVLLLEGTKLYVIECKSTLDSSLLIETLYKQSALQKEFGLRVSSVLVTMSKKDSIKSWEKQQERASYMGITIIDGTKLQDLKPHDFYTAITGKPI